MHRVMSLPLSKASNKRRSTVSTITYQGGRKHTLVDNDAKGGLFVNLTTDDTGAVAKAILFAQKMY